MTIYENNNPFAPKMTRLDFINELKKFLAPLSETERNRSILYYNEFIDDRIEDGMSEEDAIACLENPAVIAERILSEMGFSQTQTQSQSIPRYQTAEKTAKPSRGKLTGGVIALIILGFPLWFPLLITFFSLVFALVVTVWSVVFALFAAAVSCIVACIGAVIAAPFIIFGGHLLTSIFCAGGGLIAGAFGIVLGIAAIKVVKLTWTFTKFITKKSLGLFRRR
jgi:Predicted membrane protein